MGTYFNNMEDLRVQEANENFDDRDHEIESLKGKIEQQKELLTRAAGVMMKEMNKQDSSMENEAHEAPENIFKTKNRGHLKSLVKVRWRDVSHYNNSWVRRENIASDQESFNLSVGWLVKQAEGFTVVASSYSPGKDQYCGIVTIPDAAIVKIEDLESTEKQKDNAWNEI